MSVWYDKRQKSYRFQFQYLGQNHTGSGFKTKREATTGRELKRKEVMAKPVATGPTVMAFSELANQYLDYSIRKHAPKVYRYKAYIYNHFLMAVGDLPIDQVSSKEISTYLATRPSNNDYNNHRKDLCALWSWGQKTLGLTYPNPVLKIDRMPHTPANKTVPSEEDILKIILAAAPGDEQDIVLCCLHTLGRIDEVLRMTWQDVNFEKRLVTLWTRKRRNGAYEADDLPMEADLYEVLSSRWKNRTQDTWVFFNPETGARFMQRPKLMASLCKRAGIPPLGMGRHKLSPREIKAFEKKNKRKPRADELCVDFPHYFGFHVLRHFMASYLADKEKISLLAISKLLRHKKVRTTEIYLHSLDESVRVAMGQIQGKFRKPHTEPAHIKEEEVTKIS